MTEKYSTPSMVQRQNISSKLAISRRKSVKRIMTILLFLVFIALFYVGLRVDVVHIGYTFTDLKSEVGKLHEIKNKLKAEVEALKTPAKLAAIAKTEFGMRPPKGDEIIVVRKVNGGS